MMTLAKQLSSGYIPMSASVISDDIYDAIIEQSNQVGAFGHGYTYSGHPASCAVTLKTLEIHERENLFSKAEETGLYFQQQLHNLG
jgi:adenosylmethionine-8-amino-7-oxononanoate aminotransferase